MTDASRRMSELNLVHPEQKIPWIVGQIDELEEQTLSKIAELGDRLGENTAAVRESTAQNKETTRRIALAVLGALLSAVVMLVTTIIIVNFINASGT